MISGILIPYNDPPLLYCFISTLFDREIMLIMQRMNEAFIFQDPRISA